MFTGTRDKLVHKRLFTTMLTKLGSATPEFGHATVWYTRVSTILKVLSLALNTVNNLCLQALVTSLYTNACLQYCYTCISC